MKLKKLKNILKNELSSEEELQSIKRNLSFKKTYLPYIISFSISAVSLIALIFVLCFTYIKIDSVTYLGMSLSKEKTINRRDISLVSNYDYYFDPDSNVIITIDLDNKEQFEILSVTINGYKYNSYEFLDGSNGTNIYLKYNLPAESGKTSIYVDSIKYIDGTNIKESKFIGDREVEIGISYSIPLVEIYNIEKTCTSIKFAINYPIDLELELEVLNNNEVIYSSAVTNFIEINNLAPGTTYNLIIKGEMDLLDGRGLRKIELYNKDISTELPFTYEVISGTNYIELISDYNFKIYLNDKLFNNHITGLEPGVTYKLTLEYVYLGETYYYSFNVKTINTVFSNINLTKLSQSYLLSFTKIEDVLVTEIVVNDEVSFKYIDNGDMKVVCNLADVEEIKTIKVIYSLLNNSYEEVIY